MNNQTFKIVKLKPNAVVPAYQSDQAAGMDICACLDAPMIIEPMARAIVPTGVSIELTDGYEAQIRARSGLAIKNGLTLVNGIGTIDADYRGEVGILMINLGEQAFEIIDGMRVAQMVITKYERISWQESTELSSTVRGQGGFGSTGLK